jgi:hypothetical protein
MYCCTSIIFESRRPPSTRKIILNAVGIPLRTLISTGYQDQKTVVNGTDTRLEYYAYQVLVLLHITVSRILVQCKEYCRYTRYRCTGILYVETVHCTSTGIRVCTHLYIGILQAPTGTGDWVKSVHVAVVALYYTVQLYHVLSFSIIFRTGTGIPIFHDTVD